MRKIFASVGQFIFPRLCICCLEPLVYTSTSICDFCLISLDKFEPFDKEASQLDKMFWGRVNLERTDAWLTFGKDDNVRRILHEVKYRGNAKLGIEMGKYASLAKPHLLEGIDVIVPVPLHPKKEKIRGYNQAEIIAKGLVSNGQVEIKKLLKRSSNTKSQTKRSRFDRYENITNQFRVESSNDIEGKHLLLVDDVITTGATIEACARSLLQLKDVRISVFALACTSVR